MSRGTAGCPTRGRGTRTSLFGSITKEAEVLQSSAGLLKRFKQFIKLRGLDSKISASRGGRAGEEGGGKSDSGSLLGPRGDVQHLTGSRAVCEFLRPSANYDAMRRMKTKMSAILRRCPTRQACIATHVHFNCSPGLEIAQARHTRMLHFSKFDYLRIWAKVAYFSAAWARASLLAWASERTSPCLPFCLS